MELWQAYDRLCQVVLRAEAVFSTLQLSRDRCPEQLELVAVFEQANAVATALADVLDSVDRKLAVAGDAGVPSPACVEEVWDFLRELEALPDQETAGRLPLARGVAARLHRFYAFQVELDNHLCQHRIPTTFAWQENMKLWQTLVYQGGVPYLGMIPGQLELNDRIRRRPGSDPAEAAAAVDDLRDGRITAFRREQGFGVITLDDGRDVPFDAGHCTMVVMLADLERLGEEPRGKARKIRWTDS